VNALLSSLKAFPFGKKDDARETLSVTFTAGESKSLSHKFLINRLGLSWLCPLPSKDV